MPIIDAMLAEFAIDSKRSRKVLAVTPAERFDWQPHEKSMTLGQLVGHIAEIPHWGAAILQDELDFEKSPYEAFSPTTSDELLGSFEKHAAAFTQEVTGTSDEHLLGTWTLRDGEQIYVQAPRVVMFRDLILNHIVHHRGQLTVYLRLLEVPLPQTFGPTADNASF